MIETRESYQPLLKKISAPISPGKREKKAGVASYGTLKGEALLHADDSASSKQTNAAVVHRNGGVSVLPQSMELGEYAEYQQPLQTIPVQQSSLPPAIPLRRRAESSGDRSVGELSTVSGGSGHSRLQRSSSDGHDVVGAGDSLSPTHSGSANHARRSRSPMPPRSRSPAPNAGGNSGNQGNVPLAGPPLKQHRRYSSDEHSQSSGHRRTHSDVPREKLQRGSSASSLYSLNSQGSMNSESVKLLPDPRWGGGSGGNRARSFSGGSTHSTNQGGSSSHCNVSYPTDSFEGKQVGYGSVESAKEVIMKSNIGVAERGQRRHRRTNSEASALSVASVASIDRSVEPVMTDMRKSSMFKGVTKKGVVKLQLPKDNFRLLSDRDLESGCVYKRALVDNEDDYFQDYHITAADDASSTAVPFLPSDCRPKQLPPTYYVMAVDSDIYRRMFDEVAESVNMPCKLFYCGHHEDVDYPSIGIAVTGVVTILSVMLVATIYVGA